MIIALNICFEILSNILPGRRRPTVPGSLPTPASQRTDKAVYNEVPFHHN